MPKEGSGIAKLIPNVSPDAQEIITRMLSYDNSNRMSAGQALKHNYFKELREMDKSLPENQSLSTTNPGAMRLTHRGADSFSNNSKSMSKMSDNASEGSYHNQIDGHKKNPSLQLAPNQSKTFLLPTRNSLSRTLAFSSRMKSS